MSTTGLLIWGQAGSYDAQDDRMALSVIAGGAPGVWVPPIIWAGAGLNVVVGQFAAAVACGDGTLAIAQSRDNSTLAETAGPTSGSRTDEIWVDVDPNAATWSLSLVPRDQTSGRAGLSIGTVVVPAGANSAAQMTFQRSLSSPGSIRNYRNASERTEFERQNPYRAWGSWTGIHDTQGLDVLWGNRWYRQLDGQSPGYVQGGWVMTTTNNDGWARITFPRAFSQYPVVVANTAEILDAPLGLIQPTTLRIYRRYYSWFDIRAFSARVVAGGTGVGLLDYDRNSTLSLYYLAWGVRDTGGV